MANSSIVSELKKKVITAIVTDDALVYSFGATDIEDGSDLINTHIFRYNKNPNTIKETITFMTVMVHTKSRDKHGTFITPTLEIWVYSHNDHMKMNPKVTTDCRNDYISRLLDDKFNGSTEYGGIGKLSLVSNTEGTYNDKFLYRRLIFETVDVSDSFCG